MALGIFSTIGAFAKNIFKNTIGKWIGNGIKKLLGNTLGTAAQAAGGALGTAFSNNLVNGQLTGKEREQNQFNADQAALQRDFAREERLQSQQFNASQAQAQMDFQERMASTQYQRSVADMQAAGINPALAMTNGIAGASASGAMASSSPASGAAASGSTALQGLSEIMQLAKLKSDIENTNADTEKKKEETRGSKIGNDIQDEFGRSIAATQLQEMQERINNLVAQTDNEKERKGLIAAQTALAELEADPGSFKNFETTWRSAYISQFGTTPEEGLLKELVQATIKGMHDFWSAVFNWQNPFKRDEGLPFNFPTG